MIRAAVAIGLVVALSGCSVMSAVQLVPLIDSSARVVGCCAMYVEPSKQSQIGLSIESATHGHQIKAAGKLKF